ncbi:MAG: 16S rRNA processing protein RimM, partial [Muribaculaceae bacterium]|nr:16S rRNA processing protein RimM [Muribaculaceae bacterium]
MIQRSELIEIGTFRKPHGVNGEISAVADVDAALLTRFSCVVVSIDGIFVPFFIANARPKSGETVLLQIDGISSEAEASALVNKDFYVLKTEYSTICDPE